MEYEVTIGLEVHCEVKSKTKMFSKGLNGYSSEANTNVNQVDLAFPGILPTVNMEALKKSIKMALALNCDIPDILVFDRKNYYYPDLPKGYQITQSKKPIGTNGYIDIYVKDEIKRIYIHDIHIEEDTASLDHYSDYSLIDYNRAGVPLLETVTEPCMHSVDEALSFLDALRKIFLYTSVSEARLDLGQMRCDVNVSISEKGSDKLGTRVEMKNIPSFANVKDAIIVEVERQKECLKNGEEIMQETRRYDENTMKTYRMREKVDGVDYKYFTEPNIPPFKITDELINEVKSTLPRLQFERIKDYTTNYNVSLVDAKSIAKSIEVADFYEEVIKLKVNPKVASNWVANTVLGYLNSVEKEITDIYLTPAMLADLIDMVESGKISSKQGKEVFKKVMEEEKEPKVIVEKLGIKQMGNEDELRSMVLEVIRDNEKMVEQYKSGRNVYNFFVGQIMKKTSGQANPVSTGKIVKEELDKQ